MTDTISRRAAIEALAKAMPSLTTPDGCGEFDHDIQVTDEAYVDCMQIIHELPSAQPERLTDDDFETIRIHLSAYKERLCNQQRWKEAEEYQRIIDRFMTFASAQPKKGKWEEREVLQTADVGEVELQSARCSACGLYHTTPYMYYFSEYKFCPNCGADMRGDIDDSISDARETATSAIRRRKTMKHGRLIDAEKLKAHYAWWANGSEEYQRFKNLFDQIIDAQPTAVDAEEKDD